MNEKEIIDKFTQEQMAKLLIGFRIRSKQDKELIEWLMAERDRLTLEIKDLTGFK